MRRGGLIFVLAGLACTAMTGQSFAAVTDPASSLPAAPNPAPMAGSYPMCDFKPPLAALRHCATALEVFRQFKLEAFNNQIRKYINALKSFDNDLELSRKNNTTDLVSYSRLHKIVSAALVDASDNNGDILSPYRQYFQMYSDDIAAVRYQIRICITTTGCT